MLGSATSEMKRLLPACSANVTVTVTVGAGGIVGQNTRDATRDLPVVVHDVVAGLGGRPILKTSLHQVFEKAGRDDLDRLTFLDLDWNIVNKQLARERAKRRSGPTAENILRDVGDHVGQYA